MCFEEKWSQNRLQADEKEFRSLSAGGDIQGQKREGFCIVPSCPVTRGGKKLEEKSWRKKRLVNSTVVKKSFISVDHHFTLSHKSSRITVTRTLMITACIVLIGYPAKTFDYFYHV